MGQVKRFGDFLAGFGAFAAFMYLFRQFMSYDFKEIEGMGEKLEHFLSDAPTKEYRFYFALFITFALSCAISCAFHKLPYVAVAGSVIPLIQTVIMFDGGYLYERPMVFVVASIVHCAACLFECIRRDREDRGCRAALGLDLFGLGAAVFCGYVLCIFDGIKDVDPEKINVIEKTLSGAVEQNEVDISYFYFFIIAFVIIAAVRIVLRDLYFIDTALSVILAVVTVYRWNTEEITVFGSVLCFVTVAYAVGRFAVMLFCRAREKKEKVTE